MKIRMLTTPDNEWNPITQFDDWNARDQELGYNTMSYLSRILRTSPELSEEDQLDAYNSAVDQILKYNLTGNYMVVEGEETEKYVEHVDNRPFDNPTDIRF